MTDTIEATEVETEAPKKRGRKPGSGDRNFTVANQFHSELADYVNANSGLASVSPEQVKAVLLLRTDFSNTPEQVAAREARKAEIAAREQKYAGMSDEQKSAAKAAERATKHAESLIARAEEERAKAAQYAKAAEGDGAALAAVVEAQEAKATVKTPRRPRAAK